MRIIKKNIFNYIEKIITFHSFYLKSDYNRQIYKFFEKIKDIYIFSTYYPTDPKLGTIKRQIPEDLLIGLIKEKALVLI